MKDSKVIVKKDIAAMIDAAVNAANSAYDAARNAGIEAAKQARKDDDLKTNLDNIMSAYAEHLNVNHNVKAWFKDALTLSLAADESISFEKERTVDGEKVKEEIHTTGAEAAKMSKNDMRKAAKELRDDLGMGRKAGGGRAPKQPVAKVETKTAAETVTNSAAVKDAFYDQLDAILEKPEAREELIAHLKDLGWVGLRKSKKA